MKLPNPHRAVVDIGKLRDYSLNPDHPVGKHKARVFKAALGLTLRDVDWLRQCALKVALSGSAQAGSPSVFGDKYIIDARMYREDLSAVIRFCWIVESGTDFPRLTNCYVK